MNETISIIVPVYRAEAYLSRCLDSLKAQTYRDLEIWLVDDGSPDGSGRICDAYAEEDPRFHVIHQENQGVSSARNAALSRVSGTYLGFMDADDWAEPDLFRKLREGFTAKGLRADEAGKDAPGTEDGAAGSAGTSPVLSMCCFYLNESEAYYPLNRRETTAYEGNDALFFILTDKMSALWDKLFLTSRIRERNLRFDPSLTVCEDLLFIFQYLMGGELLYQPLPLYHYRQSEGSITRSGFTPSRMSLLDALEKIDSLLGPEEEALRPVIRSKYVYDSIVLIILLLIDKKPPADKKEIEKRLQGNIRRNLLTFLKSDGYTLIDKAASILLSIHPGFFARVYQILYHK